ncbi:MAG: glycosyltransferase family 2 protein [Desulfuromonas sp.]|jgi:glycosyltransferase involved in cell wall biosynthesis|nr:glycosyltransferase family 2 protein [Desulfuromonas thiophila]MDD3801392.1 glycosyltransferase family 2 protein [Desulfuromonas thiophila]MDY0398750.1 glycosyltransferase family 2 protein [Desulfuromonas thiophila]
MPTTAPRIALIIPAHNEAESLPTVLRRVPSCISQVLVVDNGSTDDTGVLARAGGARVVREERLGYGSACLAGIAALQGEPPELVAFADADGSDNHPQLQLLAQTLAEENLDLVLAQRVPKNRAALSLQQRFGNGLATWLISLLWGGNYQDLGPMRLIRWSALQDLQMRDAGYGWTIEMQIKALQQGLRVREIPLLYLPRLAGQSKISRTLRGVVRAGSTILWIVAREAWRDRRQIGWRLYRRSRAAISASINAMAGALKM